MYSSPGTQLGANKDLGRSLQTDLTLKAPVSTYKFSKLISIHFLTE